LPVSENNPLVPGLYERLLDRELDEALKAHPELRPILGKLDDEEAPHAYGQFLFQVLVQALRERSTEDRLALVNRLIELISATDGLDYLQRKTLIAASEPVLLYLENPQPGNAEPVGLTRPETSLSTSSLLTGARHDPPLEREIRHEMSTADRVDVLVSFIKWSGLRLLQPTFDLLRKKGVPVRIVTTSYMGASDPEAIAWLADQPNVSVKVSYDTQRTRLHAKAYHFHRKTGYSTAYIGSANISQAAMTSGLEWTVKVTEVEQPHILQRFAAEFATYWASEEFEPYDRSQQQRLTKAIRSAKAGKDAAAQRFFADIRPHAFQERILEALQAARAAGKNRNLVVAATGTGKTVIAAFDYARFLERQPERRARLLFVAHRKEILEQACDCFRIVLRDTNFGELLVDGQRPGNWDHVFASVQSILNAEPWNAYPQDHYDFVVIDEAHHISASSYRPILDNLKPAVLLGLTATPERMDGTSILPDFGGEFAAEIRLPEALEEKLLCPFHYFGVADPISLADERFWKDGQYSVEALTEVYTGDHIRARQRLDAIIGALARYQPDLSNTRAVGFCASVKHAHYMADAFRQLGHSAAVVVGETPGPERDRLIAEFRAGRLRFLFTVDVFNEGVDVPEINLVLFLRPTASLTVFLQQLGRGLRHAPGKDCLTVLDLVGQNHRRYRIDRKFAALLSRDRHRIDLEVEHDFPNLPPGCNIQLERVAREKVLEHIRATLRDFNTLVTESIATFQSGELTFGNFIRETGIPPLTLLKNKTWSEWKALARRAPPPSDPDLKACRQALRRVLLRTDPRMLRQIETYTGCEPGEWCAGVNESDATALHYLLWGKKGSDVGVDSLEASLAKWHLNKSSLADLREIARHVRNHPEYPITPITLPFPCPLQLHAAYGFAEIKAALGLSSLVNPGPTGVGVLHSEHLKCYVHLVTFRKSDKDFSPTTQYRDYPISRSLLHWESQSTITQRSPTGRNYQHFKERGYTILFFTRLEKRIDDEAAPFIYLGPAERLLSAKGDRPIQMEWELSHPMPAALYEAARPV
jgi:superfamily II DNA or RNA helicase